jgi:archaellum component FlaC
VDDIDAQLQNQADALTDINAAIEALTKALEDHASAPEADFEGVHAGIDENKQNIADILVAIEELQKTLEDLTNKEQESANDVENLKNAIAQAEEKIDAMEAAFDLVKGHYTTESIVAIKAIFGEASIALVTCTSVEDVAEVLAKFDSALSGYSRVDDSIYEYVVALAGKISDKTADTVKNAVAALNDAKVFYANNLKALTEYKVSATETINLIKVIEEINYAQTVLYPQAVLEAKAINNAIAKYKPLQQTSVVYLVTEIGGFYKTLNGKLVEVTATELNKQIADEDDAQRSF